jgi:DNA glycosylase AlkZ-like
LNITLQRLRTQRLAGAGFGVPADVVRWFGAVQAQDYPGALWAVGMRTSGATEADVEQAVSARTIVRTWPLRGTLHFVAPEDVRWMMTWLAPRMIARAAARFRQLELDARTFARSSAVFVEALQGNRQLSRPRLYALLERAGINTAEGRGLHILWRCAHDGLICFGAREGKQHTFALLEEWVPRAKVLDRDEALAELALRYFTSHGPATLKDFAWWSGLGAADTRRAADIAGASLRTTTIEGERYLYGGRTRGLAPAMKKAGSPHAVLLPPYDEYTVAYRDRRAALDPKHAAAARNGIFGPTLVLNGRIAATWTRRLTKDGVAVAVQPFSRLSGTQARAAAAAVARYGRFLGRPARIV